MSTVTRALPILVVLVSVLGPPAVSGQIRITGAISGTVTDASDAVLPGASVQLKDNATRATRETVTNASGYFSFPDLNHGSYQITISLQGFQTVIYNAVVVESARTTDLRVKLPVGGLQEAITVEGATPVLETSSNMMSGTLNRKALEELPLAGRDLFQQARLVLGAVAPQGTGSTHYNGMPGGVINPTIDGINNSSNGWKSGGTSFFGTVPARLGAIEEVTVETGGQGAEAGAQGGVNLKFVTRRGTNQYQGSLFWQHRNEALNANSFNNNARNLPKEELRRHDFGGNFGGRLLPGTRFRDKLFIFINYEQEYIPQTQTRERVVLRPQTEAGVFTYRTAAGEVRTANLLDIARANGLPSTIDPTIARMLAYHRDARQFGTINSTNNLLTEELSWLEPQQNDQHYPTARLDFQITPNLSWMGSWNFYRQATTGRRGWPLPGLPPQLDTQTRAWWIASTGFNWAITTSMHNEFRYGVQHSGDTIPYREAAIYEQWNGVLNGKPARFPNEFFNNTGLDGIGPIANDAAPITGRHYITTLTDTLTMIRGNHSFKFGGTLRLTDWRDTSLDAPGSGGFLGLPRYSLGMATGDPAQAVFSATSLPGVTNASLTDARNLYALLTGRVSQVQTGRILDPDTLQYSDQVYRENWTAVNFGGVFAQDQWRLTPNLTLNYGLRWEIVGPYHSKLANANFPDEANLFGPSTALFQPGVLNGVLEPTIARGKNGTRTDWNNFGPNVGFAWQPMLQGGFLAKIIGRGEDSVIRGGYSKTFYDEGTNMFAFNNGSNPGLGQSLLLQPGIGFQPGQLTLQTPLPPFVAFPQEYREVFPQSDFTFANAFRTMKHDLNTPYVHSWNIGLQRQIMKNTVVEARYVGTRGENVWRTYNINEVNIFENGFLDEFKRAQQNLRISQAAGQGNNFANRGLPGQVPLPIFETAFGPRGPQPALPSGSGFTNGGFVTSLEQGTAGDLANSLAGNANYVCRLFGNTFTPCARLGYSAPGPYPINFFLANPFAGTQGAWIVDDQSFTRYHALQLELRRRYSAGLQMSAQYTLATNKGDIWADNSTQEVNYLTLRDRSRDHNVLPFDVRHVLRVFGTYDLPFGRGLRWNVENPVLNGVLGGWTVGARLSAQSGTPFRLTSGRETFNQNDDFMVVLKNGVTVDDLQKAIRITQAEGLARYWIDPKFIGPDGRANPEFIDVTSTPGELGQVVTLFGKNVWVLDASLNKSFQLPRVGQIRLHVTMENVLNHPVWSSPGFLGTADITSTTFGQTTAPLGGSVGAREMYARIEIRF